MGNSSDVCCEIESNEEIKKGINFCFDIEEQNNKYNIHIKKEEKNINIIFENVDVEKNPGIPTVIEIINTIWERLNKFKNYNLQVIKDAIKDLLLGIKENDQIIEYLKAIDEISNNQNNLQSLLKIIDLFKIIYENKDNIGNKKITFFIESIRLQIKNSSILTTYVNIKTFINFLYIIYNVTEGNNNGEENENEGNNEGGKTNEDHNDQTNEINEDNRNDSGDNIKVNTKDANNNETPSNNNSNIQS